MRDAGVARNAIVIMSMHGASCIEGWRAASVRVEIENIDWRTLARENLSTAFVGGSRMACKMSMPARSGDAKQNYRVSNSVQMLYRNANVGSPVRTV